MTTGRRASWWGLEGILIRAGGLKMREEPIPQHPWSWFHLRRFVRRGWPGLLALALLAGAWLVYGLYIFEPGEYGRVLDPVSARPLEDFTFDDPAWLFQDCVGPEQRYAVLTKHESGIGSSVYSTAVLDLNTSQTLAHLELGRSPIVGRVFYRDGEILACRWGLRETRSARLVESLGSLGRGLNPSQEAELFRIDLKTGLPSELIPLGSPFYPTDISRDGRLLAGSILSDQSMQGSGVFDLESRRMTEYPAFSLFPLFEDSNDLILPFPFGTYMTRIEAGTGRVTHLDGYLNPQQREAGFFAEWGGIASSADDGATRYHIRVWRKLDYPRGRTALSYIAKIALDGSLDQTLYWVDREAMNQYSVTQTGSTRHYPAMFSNELGIQLFFDQSEAVFWNYRGNRLHRIPRQNQNEIIQLLNARFVADKTGNRFRIHRVEDYFPSGFLGEEPTP